MCHSEGEWARQHIEVPFERGIIVGVRRTGSCKELQRCWVFHTDSCVYQEWPTTQRTSSQLDTAVGSIGVNMDQHPCGALLTPCESMPQRIEAVLRAKGLGATQY